MYRVTIATIIALFLTMKIVTGQALPPNCYCILPNDSHEYCTTRGCSNGTNPDCTNGFSLSGSTIVFGFNTIFDIPVFDAGCNCPSNPYNGTNGYYSSIDPADPGGPFTYNTCTEYGLVGGHLFGLGTNATDCCNFCCNRNDPLPPSVSVSSN